MYPEQLEHPGRVSHFPSIPRGGLESWAQVVSQSDKSCQEMNNNQVNIFGKVNFVSSLGTERMDRIQHRLDFWLQSTGYLIAGPGLAYKDLKLEKEFALIFKNGQAICYEAPEQKRTSNSRKAAVAVLNPTSHTKESLLTTDLKKHLASHLDY
ncbi:hypothetical protein ARMGADRAFT_1039482 [Armillaria gallica]|uniref:Uncharacterized protein n=1 Tax=Armillaria gallica TaxID=47427 RepID=A0A2H3CPQ0_ARMGA|nr:hypothetical protein ARMGADRAFT_1039482 [Armillaria gallica]